MDDAYGNADLSRRLWLTIAQIFARTTGDLDPLLRDAGLTAGDLGDLPTEALRRFSAPLVARIAIDLNRADNREPMRPGDWRLILYCLGSARSLREAITRCSECFDAIDQRMGRMALHTYADVAELRLDSLRSAPTIAGCVIDLVGVAHFHGMLGWLIAHRLPFGRIALNYDRALFEALDLPTLPLPVVLDAGWTGFAFPAVFLDYPIVRANDEVIDWPQQGFLFTGSAGVPVLPAADAVRRFAYKALREDHRLPAFEHVVRHLRSSNATLRRRLTEAGTSWRAIRNSCRRELGLELLRGSTLTVEQISDRLDFADSDAFRSAFREWMGVSPSRYRQSVRTLAVAHAAPTSPSDDGQPG
ncbi:helix-turn-helix domain-containing protein [Novosphingobium sp.]|uniref:helix-turn-helix transcriptional regulator n=1 Tax=Novosphingobium sp. TaxID=1874826 RepID=UPI003B52C089